MSIKPKKTDPISPIGLVQSFIRWGAVICITGLCLYYADNWIQAVILGGAP